MSSESSTASATVRGKAGWYKRLFASVMNSNDSYEKMVSGRKRALLSNLHGNILEIGPGTGPNLAYYPSDVRWLGIEPNPAMYPYLQREAKRLGMTFELRDGHAEQLDAADNSMDAVVGTLVFCSVHDQQKALQEVLRVLKPGGRYVFIEHVAAPRDTGQRRVQNLTSPLYQLTGDGCHPNRETWTAIENAGFDRVQIEHFRLDVPIVGTQIAGYAIK